MEKYQAKMTLCRLAAIAISKHLWKYSDLRDALEACIDTEAEEDVEPENTMPFVLIDVLESFVVPEAATEELHFAIGTMGRELWDLSGKLQDAYPYSTEDNDDDLFTSKPSTYMNHIHWTIHGCLDAAEIIRSLYFSEVLPEKYATWILLCIYCLEDCIADFWPKMEDIDHDSEWVNRGENASYAKFDMILLAYWTARMKNDIENAIDVVFRELPDGFYDNAYSLEENMFINSFVENRFWAVKYFWGLLNENQRMRSVAKICERIMSDDPTTQKYKDLFASKRKLSGHLLMFFLQQLSHYGLDDTRIRILGSGFVLLQLLEWPYDNFFFETLRESLIHHDSIDYGPIISRIFLNICGSAKYQFLFGDVKYRRIFYRLWQMNPKDLKSSVDYDKSLEMLWQSKDLDLVDYILRDPELKDRREQFLNRIVEVYGWRPDNNLMEKFITKFLVSDEEREFFRSRMLPEFIESEDEETENMDIDG